jgi:hypothetical protein
MARGVTGRPCRSRRLWWIWWRRSRCWRLAGSSTGAAWPPHSHSARPGAHRHPLPGRRRGPCRSLRQEGNRRGRRADTERSRVLDIARGSRWPAKYTARTLGHPFLAEWRGREDSLAADPAARQAYQDGVARGDLPRCRCGPARHRPYQRPASGRRPRRRAGRTGRTGAGPGGKPLNKPPGWRLWPTRTGSA